jgi:RNA polymerase sigma-70 factor (ECF subfamily)
MPERRRMIFEMSRFEGLKYGEIAKKLNISIKTVEIQMSKALEFMRDKLSDYLPFWWWVLLFLNLF